MGICNYLFGKTVFFTDKHRNCGLLGCISYIILSVIIYSYPIYLILNWVESKGGGVFMKALSILAFFLVVILFILVAFYYIVKDIKPYSDDEYRDKRYWKSFVFYFIL